MPSQELNKPHLFFASDLLFKYFYEQRNRFDIIKIHLLRTKNITSGAYNSCGQF